MVALSGSWGRLAPSLVAMVKEADRLAPRRSRISDGSLGDASHAARSSFHNPSGGYVDALDLTHDPAHGWDVHARARALVKRGDIRLDHVISNRQIWSATHPYWRKYTGINGHTHHAHFAVKRNRTGRSGMGQWWPTGSVSIPKPVVPIEGSEMSFFASAKSDATVWLFEPGRRTLIGTGDRAAVAKAAAIPNVVAEVSDDFFRALSDGRTRHQ